MEEMSCETVFTIPVLGGIPVNESVVVTWIIMAALTLASILMTRNLRIENPGKVQIALESFFSWIYGFFDDLIGKEGRRYVPYLVTVLIFLGVSNAVVGFFGFKPPTKDMNMTVALALMSMVLIEYSGISKRGAKGWLKHMAEPVAIVAPMNFMEIFIRPLSLCMRLFGNIFAAFTIMELIKYFAPLIVPLPFSFYFDIFDGLLQAYIFVFLTAIYIGEQTD